MVRLPYAWILLAFCLASFSNGSLDRHATTKNKETSYKLAELKTIPAAEVAATPFFSYGRYNN